MGITIFKIFIWGGISSVFWSENILNKFKFCPTLGRGKQGSKMDMMMMNDLCAHHLLNQWPEFDQTSTDTSLGRGKEVIKILVSLTLFSRSLHYKDSKTLSHESIDGI